MMIEYGSGRLCFLRISQSICWLQTTTTNIKRRGEKDKSQREEQHQKPTLTTKSWGANYLNLSSIYLLRYEHWRRRAKGEAGNLWTSLRTIFWHFQISVKKEKPEVSVNFNCSHPHPVPTASPFTIQALTINHHLPTKNQMNSWILRGETIIHLYSWYPAPIQ